MNEITSKSEYDNSPECSICVKGFHAFRRKHRCKSCGNAVCSTCARTHKVLPKSNLVNCNEPVRVCDRCVTLNQAIAHEHSRSQQGSYSSSNPSVSHNGHETGQNSNEVHSDASLIEQSRAAQVADLQSSSTRGHSASPPRHDNAMGTVPGQNTARIIDDGIRVRPRDFPEDTGSSIPPPPPTLPADAPPYYFEPPSDQMSKLQFSEMTENMPTPVTTEAPRNTSAHPETQMEVDECAICLEPLEIGRAIFTTSCGHNFHWGCLKDIQKSDTSNYDKCPSCRSTMPEMQIKKTCDHPRLRPTHKYCRDCGENTRNSVPTDPPTQSHTNGFFNSSTNTRNTNAPSSQNSYRAGDQGAIVRCPQCRMQMRVLPHMYNMRVACPAGHQFQVSVQRSGGQSSTSRGGYPGTNYRQQRGMYGQQNNRVAGNTFI